MLSTPAWIAGALGAALVLVVVAWGARQLRRRLLPTWVGAQAVLVDALLCVATILTTAQLLGAVHLFSRWAVALGAVSAGAVMGFFGRRSRPPDGDDRGSSAREPGFEVAVAAGAAALVVGQWLTHVAVTLSRGITHTDSIWYHLPYAARFLGRHRLLDRLDRADALHTYVSHNAELVQAVAMLPFGRDVLAPLVNLGWLALALLAAWCVGRTAGVGALSVLGAVVVLGLPPLAGTHPGQASNDVAAGALVLTAVAVLLHGRLAPAPTALAAVAAGLAIATKQTVLAPVAVLTLGVLVLTVRRRRAAAAAWVVPLTVFGCFWFVRNAVVAHNPLPWFELDVGPLHLPATTGPGEPFVKYLFDGFVWRTFYLPGLRQALSATWPVLLLAGIGSSVVGLIRTRDPLLRVVGAVVVTGVVSYAFTPLTADARGLSFVFNLRYLTPTLLLGFAVLPLWVPDRPRWRTGLAVALAGQVVVNAFLRHYEGIDAWPPGEQRWLVVGAALVVAAVAWHRLGRPFLRPVRVAAAGLAAVVVLAGGAFMQRHYLEQRYVRAGLPLDAINERFRSLSDQDVAIAGSLNIYPLFGLDLSNRVARVDVTVDGTVEERCRRWKRQINDGDYDYVVTGVESFFVGIGAPPDSWLDEPAAKEVLRDGGGVVYRLSGPLDVNRCATPTPPAPAPGA